MLNFAVGEYTREAGVRTLERKIGALCRAVAVQVAEPKTEDQGISDYLLVFLWYGKQMSNLHNQGINFLSDSYKQEVI